MGIIDLLIVAVIALVTWCVAAEGAVGAGTTFLGVVLSGLVAMNFFEPLADLLDDVGFIGDRADMIALLGLFAVSITLVRLGAERIQPTFVSLQGLLYDVGRWGFAFLTAYVTAGILLTALHTAPLPRDFLGFRPERTHLLFDAFAPDREWMGFAQYVTERPFARHQKVQDPTVGDIIVPRIFDGRTAYHWGLHALGSTRVEEEARKSNAGGALTDKDLAEAATRIVIPSFVLRYAKRRRETVGGAPAEFVPAPAPAGPTGGPAF
jgi:hypothetical protein